MALDLERVMRYLALPHKKKFIYRGKELPIEKVFAFDGALPIFVKKANLLADFLFGAPLKVSFPSDGAALTGERLQVSEQQKSFVLVMLLYDVLEEFIVTAGSGNVDLG
jgi:hypothetical protein